MTSLNIELRKISLSKSLSEETPAYTADLYLDGRKVAELSNHGHGGCDMVRWTCMVGSGRVTAYFASLPPETHQGYELQPDLEMWAHGVVWDMDLLKTIKRSLAKKVHGIVGGKELVWKLPPDALDKPMASGKTGREIIMAKQPGMVILNGLSDADLLKAIKGMVA